MSKPVGALAHIRPFVFWPPAVILVLALGASIVDFDRFLAIATRANQWILGHFDVVIALAAFAAVLLMAAVFVSPLGAVRIGGAAAKPVLKRWNWFAITLCTTIATGILFWGSAEPIFHLNAPPDFSGADPRSPAAARFALSTLFMHWAITPYAIYAVPSIAFALAYFNLNKPYSLAGPLGLVIPSVRDGLGAALIDALALFALVAGVAASLGAGIMTLAGGLNATTPLHDGPAIRFVIALAIVAAYVASSISGLKKGIRVLSDLNVRVFFALAFFVLLAGPTLAILRLGPPSVGDYAGEFLPRSIGAVIGDDRQWMRDWTIFYYANWLAWAPITALFLGRIAYGYTVREAIIFNLLAPAAFGMVWMTIFGGASLRLDALNDGALTAALEADGPEAVIYGVFDYLPLTGLVVGAFIFSTFISFVTAMDSNTHSIASVCLREARQEQEKRGAGLWIKIFWGALIGSVAYIMTATSGIDGVRMLSNLGGLPGLFILIGAMAALIRLMTMTERLKGD